MQDYRNEFADVDPAAFAPAEYEAMKQAAGKKERTELVMNASLLAILLLLYNVFCAMYRRLYWYVAYTRYTGKFSLDLTVIGDYFTETNPDVTNTTAFIMTAAVFVVVMAAFTVFVVGQFMMGIKFTDIFKPRSGAVTDGVKYFPAQITINHFASMMMIMLTTTLQEEGITLPESDFSMESPSSYGIFIEFIYLCVAGPLVEEFIYRGMCLKLLAPFGSGLAIAFSSVTFGLMHGNLKQAVPAMMGGVVYALVAVKYNSIVPSLIIHILNNIVSSITDFGDALGWSNTNAISNAVFIVVLFVGLYGVVVLLVDIAEKTYSDEPKCVLPAGKRFLTVGTNIFCIIYFLYLMRNLIEKIIQANLN